MPFGPRRRSSQPIAATLRSALIVLAFLISAVVAQAQFPSPLDPTRNLPTPAADSHPPLPEQYLWTANDVTALRPDHSKFPWNRPGLRTEPHYFRARFHVGKIPAHATLYLAGPREAHVFLNGHPLAGFYSDPDAPIGFHVFHADASALLQAGDNVLAISAIRGRGIVAGAGPVAVQQLTYGEVLAAKILPARFGVEAPAIVVSDSGWRSSPTPAEGWSKPAFNDEAWLPVQSLGPIESNIDLFQWSADAGMYGWPGYRGMSAPLRNYALPAVAVTHVFTGPAKFSNVESLTDPTPGNEFTVTFPPQPLTDAESPVLLLDFGREVAGRLLIESASSEDSTLSIAYGESELEALATGLTSEQQGGNYLGTNLLEVPANGIARGPKSAFRYVRVRFLRGAPTTAFKSIRLEGIYYPAAYAGSFESSDPLLNRIWETGAYTAHLCMQDGLWDAPKRDRGRWVGDIDVEGRVLASVFADNALTEDTLRRLAEATGPSQYVNGIRSYSALWITSLATLYQHTGDKAFLASQHDALLRILARLDQDFAPNNLIPGGGKNWDFVDWAPGLYGSTPEAQIGTNLQYLRGFSAGAELLKALGDNANADRYTARTKSLTSAASSYLADGTLGRTWQLNSLAVLTHLSGSHNVWPGVLAHVKQDSPTDQVISPYFGAYLLDAMSSLGHRREALDWIRTYWGGMLAEGATSFWESYDLRWPKTNPHLSLQADGTSGFFVSLAHGWSSGPTAWLMENVLGVTPLTPGYDTVSIQPNLLGLSYARGSVPTPHGPIEISLDKEQGVALDLPAGIQSAMVVIPRSRPNAQLFLDGKLKPDTCYDLCKPSETLHIVEVPPGHHTLESR